jgi:hypothetical protein
MTFDTGYIYAPAVEVLSMTLDTTGSAGVEYYLAMEVG